LSSYLALIAEAARDDAEAPEDWRNLLWHLLDGCVDELRIMERRLPQPPAILPEGCIDLQAERLRRRLLRNVPAEASA